MNKCRILLILIFISMSFSIIADDEFGRFYTTPRQRLQLDEQRAQMSRDDIVIVIAPQEIIDTALPEEPNIIIDSITLNGLVYRSDGKNTAWINNNSSNEGSIENQFTSVSEDNVHSNNVNIRLPDNKNHIELKVGEQYDVRSKQVYDVVEDPINANPKRATRDNNQSR